MYFTYIGLDEFMLPTTPPLPGWFKVKRGESLWLIARKYDVRIKDIVAVNKLAQEKYIKPGQRLQIPADFEQNFVEI